MKCFQHPLTGPSPVAQEGVLAAEEGAADLVLVACMKHDVGEGGTRHTNGKAPMLSIRLR